MFHSVLLTLWILMAVTPLISGLPYYLTPVAERGYSTLHELFKPSGPVGHSLGLLGSLMMVIGVAMYSARKRVRFLNSIGRLRTWLDVHIFLCTLGPCLVTWHTSFKIGGLVSISYWSMVIVVASGIVGRYVYVRIPKSVNGRFASAETVTREKEALVQRIVRDFGVEETRIRSLLLTLEDGVSPGMSGILDSMRRSLVFDWSKRSRGARIRRAIVPIAVRADRRAALATEIDSHLRLQHQVVTLRSFRRLFGYWHVFHLPLAIVMFLIMFVHIGIIIAFGYGWVL